MDLPYLLCIFFSLASMASARSEPKSVVAHFLVGNAAAMTAAEWESDIREAQKAHIDGFALNIGVQDNFTDRVLGIAYDAAETVGNFSLFLSFDYLTGGSWPADRVITTINTYKDRRAQFQFQGRPLVSTFEGTDNTQDWPAIRAATGCAAIPSWTSLGPAGIVAVLDNIDGMLSWDAWPVGAENKSVTSDLLWMKALARKTYMMPVAPWFYTNLPDWNKNWLWRGDDLWHERWQQVIDLQPALVEIISWNDYGETHYIGPIHETGVPQGASRYVANHPHDAWRSLLPYYIDAYKYGTGPGSNISRNCSRASRHRPVPVANLTTSDERIVYWYRRNPGRSGSANGTTGNNPDMGQTPLHPGLVSEDKIFLTVLVTRPSTVYVQIGSFPSTVLHAVTVGINHFSVPFNGQTGSVKITIVRNNQKVLCVTGPAITDQCANGLVDWNAFVGSSDASS